MFSSVDARAKHHTAVLLKHLAGQFTHIHLIGYSFGGLLASSIGQWLIPTYNADILLIDPMPHGSGQSDIPNSLLPVVGLAALYDSLLLRLQITP